MGKRKGFIAVVLAAALLTGCAGSGEGNGDLFSNLANTSGSSAPSASNSKPASSAANVSSSSAVSSVDSAPVSSEASEPSAEPEIVYTQSDIDEIHKYFADYAAKHSDSDFDYSETAAKGDFDSLLFFICNRFNIFFGGVNSDKTDEEEGDFGEWITEYYKPQTIEKIIREKLIPDFDISGYDYASSASWDKDSGMFKGLNGFAFGYSFEAYGIIDEYQTGNYYCVEVFSCRGDDKDGPMYFISPANLTKEKYEEYLSLAHQRYFFRKLPSGNIAPCKMNGFEPYDWEKSAVKFFDLPSDCYIIDDLEKGKIYFSDGRKLYAPDTFEEVQPSNRHLEMDIRRNSTTGEYFFCSQWWDHTTSEYWDNDNKVILGTYHPSTAEHNYLENVLTKEKISHTKTEEYKIANEEVVLDKTIDIWSINDKEATKDDCRSRLKFKNDISDNLERLSDFAPKFTVPDTSNTTAVEFAKECKRFYESCLA